MGPDNRGQEQAALRNGNITLLFVDGKYVMQPINIFIVFLGQHRDLRNKMSIRCLMFVGNTQTRVCI